MKVGMISLGCSKNLVDTELVLGKLIDEKFEIVADAAKADMIIINTCGFINEAKQEAISVIFETLALKEENPNVKVVVMGCLTQRYKEELVKEISEVDRFIAIDEYDRFGEIIGELTNRQIKGGLNYYSRFLTTKPFTAYQKIAEGCNNRCAFCAIPLIRGPFKSRDYDEVLNETIRLVQEGRKEINLISQDTSRYGMDITKSRQSLLGQLLLDVARIKGVEIVRPLYLYPDEITDELIDIMTNSDIITPYFDIPIQHASNRILKAMNRRGNNKFIEDTINKIRKKAPHAVIRTSIIVGFPGESDKDFEELIDFIERVRFDRLGVFSYSSEEDTPASEFDNQIPNEIKLKRQEELMKAQSRISYQLNIKRIGQIHKAIIEGYDSTMKMYKARSYAFAPDDIDGYLYVKSSKELKMGEVVSVKITSAHIHDLIGTLNT